MTKKRIDLFDITKGLGILLMVAGHIYENEVFNIIVYSFHMPLFLIVSGMLINITSASKNSYSKLLKSKFKRLVLPYIITELVCIPLFYLRGGYGIHDIPWIILDSVLLYAVKGVATWFLLGLFLAEMIYYLIIKLIPNRFVVIGLCTCTYVISLIFTFPSRHIYLLVRGLHMMFFLMLGHQFTELFTKKRKAVINLALMAISLTIAFLNGHTTMVTLLTGNVFFYTITGITGSALIIALCQFVSHSKNKIVNYIKKHLIFWGKETVIVLCTHLIFMRYGVDLILKAGPHYSFFSGSIIFLIIMLLEYILVIIKRTLKTRNKSSQPEVSSHIGS